MAKKEPKTNAMRILERKKIAYEIHRYECKEFIDGIAIADMLDEPYERVFKTLVTAGKSGDYFVFVIPIHKELDLKRAARAVGEKAVEMIHVKDINKITGYIRGGCTAIGMKKDYPVVLDASAMLQETIMVSGGKNGIQIELKPDDYLAACRGKTAEITREGESAEG
ncbi:MAG TPA: Cys-tRNA(Pro) deacylase [Candidatus Anaerostipes excrementavium]|mgnify:FL=1|uniref:Cys-tRNA(Pro)/Cys-tRNA(Cys) deacylase n=1 Tax=Candidatus Anaerostipes excrementavium TaxID=2838463 RepID=A0A9D2B9S1_9FIRM|nr:Cys-tRNA(Pro) deacylase [uncultured Anaerostipes sp.]HIX68261.1 Cys-tRNA(Pro) deacylase [Candidatus Anaerostipes excrementavium]